MTRRLRMIAGPNGSGKTTLVSHLRTAYSLPLGYYLNPDELEREFLQRGRLDFSQWGVQLDEASLRAFLAGHPLSKQVEMGDLKIMGNELLIERPVPGGYLASILSDFLRRRWLAAGASFTFETVMSSRDKLDLMRDAAKLGYRTYLYYICTNSALINEERVASRVRKGGHDVPKSKIQSRYDRSLDLLAECIGLTDRAYLFDNSAESHQPVAEFESGRLVTLYNPPPDWFIRAWPDLQTP